MNMDWLINKCGEYQEAISLLAADRLPNTEKMVLEEHLTRCTKCRTELAQLKRLSSDLTTWKNTQIDLEPSREASFRLRRALRDTERAPQPLPAPILLRWWPRDAKKALFGALSIIWGLIFFFNLDSPKLIPMGERSQPASASAILMVIKATHALQWPELQESPPQSKPKNPYQTKDSKEASPATKSYCWVLDDAPQEWWGEAPDEPFENLALRVVS